MAPKSYDVIEQPLNLLMRLPDDRVRNSVPWCQEGELAKCPMKVPF